MVGEHTMSQQTQLIGAGRTSVGVCEWSCPGFCGSWLVTDCHTEISWHRDFGDMNQRLPGLHAGVLCSNLCHVVTGAWFAPFQGVPNHQRKSPACLVCGFSLAAATAVKQARDSKGELYSSSSGYSL